MIIQRLHVDQDAGQGKLVIETNPDDANSLPELISLQEELALRANVKTEGSIVKTPPAPPMPEVG